MTGKTVWLDVLTPKQALLMHYLSLKLRSKGYETIITCRKYDYIESLLKGYEEKFVSIGEHGGRSLSRKLAAYAKRTLELTKLINEVSPSVLISYPSPSGCRVAFGLGIPIILMNDTPHAEAVNKLTIPLANYLIFSKCIPLEAFKPYTLPGTKIYQFNGVDELEWVINYKPPKQFKEKTLSIINLDKPFIIFRPEETQASYYKYRPVFHKVLKYIASRFDGTIVFLPRYEHQRKHVLKRFKNIIVPETALDLRVLYPKASLVITGGATIAREAALMGTPSISYFPRKTPVNECVSSWGFPLYNTHDWFSLRKHINALLEERTRLNENQLRKIYLQLEKPSTAVIKVLEELNSG